MAWPKGKSRKQKEEPVKFTTKSDVTPTVKVEKNPGPVVWKPAPDMGKIVPPAEAEKGCSSCPHKRAVHYGGPLGWCNTGGCNCQEFK